MRAEELRKGNFVNTYLNTTEGKLYTRGTIQALHMNTAETENNVTHPYNLLEGVEINDEWFTKFDEDLKFLFEDSTTQLKFNYKLRKFSLLQSYREFTFQSLSSGFTAIFDIYSDLLMRSRLLNILPNNCLV